jgi:hypothetical protein
MIVEKFCNSGRWLLRFNPWRVFTISQCQVVSYIFSKLKKTVTRYRCIGKQFWYSAPGSQGLQELTYGIRTYAQHLKQSLAKLQFWGTPSVLYFKLCQSRAATVTTNNRSKSTCECTEESTCNVLLTQPTDMDIWICRLGEKRDKGPPCVLAFAYDILSLAMKAFKEIKFSITSETEWSCDICLSTKSRTVATSGKQYNVKQLRVVCLWSTMESADCNSWFSEVTDRVSYICRFNGPTGPAPDEHGGTRIWSIAKMMNDTVTQKKKKKICLVTLFPH